ncbi:hypothetical protein ACIOD1_12740 [Streptomyces sp. NPDC088097]|uniref:hypothetical protein n=1 Tax=Streptomyces sp. NPDC088097 TaxID=3365823 RepID=UPI0037F167AD
MSARARIAVLHRLFVQQPGPIKTGSVVTYYQVQGLAPGRNTVRHDLRAAYQKGLIYHTGPENDRRWHLRSIGGGR